MTKILFVITSSENLGDLALCQEWIADLGRDQYAFGFLLARDLQPFVSHQDTLFFYEYYISVRDRIFESYNSFRPDVLIFASNSFWNLPGYFGVRFGEFALRPGEVNIPVLSFDPFEIGIRYEMLTHQEFFFSEVPDWVWALRYMSTQPTSPNAVHFKLRQTAFTAQPHFNREIIARWGGNPDARSVFFPVSLNRLIFIRKEFPLYYEHLAAIFEQLNDNVQIFILSPKEIIEFTHIKNVHQLPLLQYSDFHDLVAASDVYITDSYISCIFNALMLGVPSVLLYNSEKSAHLCKGTFLENNFITYKVFPYGLDAASTKLESVWGTEGCYAQLEVLNVPSVLRGVQNILNKGPLYRKIMRGAGAWREARAELPAPRDALHAILDQPQIFPGVQHHGNVSNVNP